MRVRELLDVPDLGLRLLTDVAGMDRAIRRVYTTDLPDPSRYLTPGDLVLTGLIWCRAPGRRRPVRVGPGPGGSLRRSARARPWARCRTRCIRACGRHGLPLLAVPAETSFAAVTDEVGRRLSGDRATEMTRVLGRAQAAALGGGRGRRPRCDVPADGPRARSRMLAADRARPGRRRDRPGAARAAGAPARVRVPRGRPDARRYRGERSGAGRRGSTRCSGWAVSRGSPAGSSPARAVSRTGRTNCANPWPNWPPTWRWNGPGWTPPVPATASWPRRSSPCSRPEAARAPRRPRSPR